MPKKQNTRANASARVVSTPPKGAMRVTVRVRRTGRTMRMSVGEARALHAINVIDYLEAAPAPVAAPTYNRRDMVAVKPAAVPMSIPIVAAPVPVLKDDGEA